MSQQQTRFDFELFPYQIQLFGGSGETTLVYQTLCTDDDEAIDALFALKNASYARFEISCDGELISQGVRCK